MMATIFVIIMVLLNRLQLGISAVCNGTDTVSYNGETYIIVNEPPTSNICKGNQQLRSLDGKLFCIAKNQDPSKSSIITCDKNSKNQCLTPGCRTAAAEMIKNIDTTVDPCNDFYDFACGGFLKKTTIPDHMPKIDSFGTINLKIKTKIRRLLEETPPVGADEPEIYTDVRNLYKSCMDEDYFEKNSRTELLNVVKDFGGWPVLMGEKFDSKNFIWQKMEENTFKYGNQGNIVQFLPASRNNKRVILIEEPTPYLEREYLIKGFEDKDVQAYYRYMVNIAVYLGAAKEKAEAELKGSLMFEIQLAKMILPKEEKRNASALDNWMTIADFNKLLPYKWEEFFNNIIMDKDLSMNASMEVVVTVPKFFKELGVHIPTIPRVLANYIMWRQILIIIDISDTKVENINFEFQKNKLNLAQPEPRWERCVKFIIDEGIMKNALGSMYIKKFKISDLKSVTEAMFEDIRSEFKLILDEEDWLDAKTKAKALIKLDKMTAQVAYPPELLDNNLINQYYKRLDIMLDPDSFLQKKLKLRMIFFKYNLGRLIKPVDKNGWEERNRVTWAEASYSVVENLIRIPAGILDGVFFEIDRPKYLNYGAIGSVIGHEIIHGFDDMGIQYDENGTLVNWWGIEARSQYINKTQCIIDQYSNISVDVNGEKLSLNGINTQGENVADNGGFRMAYRAYKRHVGRTKEPEGLLTGISWSPAQLFWLSAATMWCSKERPGFLKNIVLVNVHSPSRFRVVGSFRNLKDFSQDWNCAARSPMNPDKKCKVW